MWKNFSLRAIRGNKVSSGLLAGISLISALLLSFLCTMGWNLWTDHVKQQRMVYGVQNVRPGRLFSLYGILLFFVCLALIAMIHHAFGVTMRSRLQQLGILQSVGATPGQIRRCLLEEVVILCFFPILLGTILGVGVCFFFIQTMIHYGQSAGAEVYGQSFSYHGLVAALSLGTATLTIFLSAWLPARKLSRMTPLDAIFGREEHPVKKVCSFPLWYRAGGISGELAARTLYVRKKSLREAKLILGLSFFCFFAFLNAETISGLSTRHTYYERYKDVWDFRITLDASAKKEGNTEDFLSGLRAVPTIESCIAYQKAEGQAVLPPTTLSAVFNKRKPELLLEKSGEKTQEGNWKIKTQMVILDDQSFKNYCSQQNLREEAGAVALNLWWDEQNSDWKNRTYLPLLKEKRGNLLLELGGKLVSVRYSDVTNALPPIREEMEQKALTIIFSRSAYAAVLKQEGRKNRGKTTSEIYYDLCVGEDSESQKEKKTEKEIQRTEDQLRKYCEQKIPLINKETGRKNWSLENRRKEQRSDQEMRKGLRMVTGTLAMTLALVGIANILSVTLGQIYLRRKEFARYLSVGMSPGQMRKILYLEALLLVGKPYGFALLMQIPLLALLLPAAPIRKAEFFACMPVGTIALFGMAAFAIILIFYGIAGRKLCRENIMEILK